MPYSPEPATLAVTIIPVSLAAGVGTPGDTHTHTHTHTHRGGARERVKARENKLKNASGSALSTALREKTEIDQYSLQRARDASCECIRQRFGDFWINEAYKTIDTMRFCYLKIDLERPRPLADSHAQPRTGCIQVGASERRPRATSRFARRAGVVH